MGYAPVIAFDTAKRAAMARQLLALGVHRDRITATTNDTELHNLWTRERTVASLHRLTGQPRALLDMWDTPELQDMERRALQQLMSPSRAGDDRLIYSIAGRQPTTRRGRRVQANRAWGIDAA